MSLFLSQMAFRAQERLLGRRTFAVLSELDRSQHWPRERIETLQLQRLRWLLAIAYEKTPYWHRLMDAQGISPFSIRSLDDLRQLPLLDKATLRCHREQMAWLGQGRRVMLVRTSGSTNEALQFYTSSTREAAINAARIRGHRWIGIDKGNKEVYFWGAPVELNSQDRVKQVRDWVIHDRLTNALALCEQSVRRYVQQWADWGAHCLFGFPSCLALLANMARQYEVDLNVLRRRGLKVICTTAEVLGAQRQLLTEAFGVPVYDSYGLREAGLIGHECPAGTMHTTDEQLILETIDPQTLEPTDGEGELVVTNLVGLAMPIIRYRTGDLVMLSRTPCSCGVSLNSVTVSGGRMLDFVVSRGGRWVGGVAFIYAMRSLAGIVKFQVRQERVGLVNVVLVVDRDFPADGVERVRRAVLDRLGGDDEVLVEIVSDIEPAPSGKYRPVISDVARQLRSSDRLTLPVPTDA